MSLLLIKLLSWNLGLGTEGQSFLRINATRWI